jgi:uncharacterized protein
MLRGEKKMNKEEIGVIFKKHKPILSTKYYVNKIGIFGSYSRNEQTETSDIDVLVEFSRPVGFFKFLDLKDYLESICGKSVDLVTPRALKPYFRDQILDEVIFQ